MCGIDDHGSWFLVGSKTRRVRSSWGRGEVEVSSWECGCFNPKTVREEKYTWEEGLPHRGAPLRLSKSNTTISRMATTTLSSRFARSSKIILGTGIRNYTTTKEILPLAYHLHEPTGSSGPQNDAPMVVMHGLFGSKQNHRSISK